MTRDPIRVKPGERVTIETSDGPVTVAAMPTDDGDTILFLDTPPGVEPTRHPVRRARPRYAGAN